MWQWKKCQNTLGEIIKMEIKISFLYHNTKRRKIERAQAGINWEDSEPGCFAMTVIYKKILFWMLLKYQRILKVKNQC